MTGVQTCALPISSAGRQGAHVDAGTASRQAAGKHRLAAIGGLRITAESAFDIIAARVQYGRQLGLVLPATLDASASAT